MVKIPRHSLVGYYLARLRQWLWGAIAPRGGQTVPGILFSLKGLGLGIILFITLGWGNGNAMAATAKHYSELSLPPLPEVTIPDYYRYDLANGLTVYLIEDHQWPIVRGSVILRAGSRWDPPDRVGLADISGELLRNGGTREHPAPVLDQLLEERAATIESSIGKTLGRVNFTSLRENVPEVLDWFAEVIQTPAIAENRFALAQQRRQGLIARRNDNPDGIAQREFYKLIYGSDSPYARSPEYLDIANITLEDVGQFYDTYLHPSRMILGIVGDFDREQMEQMIQDRFGAWNPPLPPPLPLPVINSAKNDPGLFLVDRPNLSQSYIYLGHLGGTLEDPDVFSLYVLNGVLNGFGGRLFNQVRSRQGLAYSVYAAWNPEFDYPGIFYGKGQTQSSSTLDLIQALKTEIRALQQEPISAPELAYAKESILNSFVFNFRDSGQVLARLMRYEYFGYPSDFIFRYQQGVKATQIKDVQQVARQHLHPDDLTTLIVGEGRTLRELLEQESIPITSIDVTIPAPVGANS